jgi:cell division transport system permease protein
LFSLLENHLFTVVSSLGRLWRHPLNSLMTIGVIAIALALPAGLYSGLKNLRGLGSGWEELGDIALYLEPDTEALVAESLAEELTASAQFESVTLVTPEQGLASFAAVSGFTDTIETLPANPLPYVLVLRPGGDQRTASDLAELARQLVQRPEVELAQLDQEWLERFNGLINIAQRVVVVIGSLLAIAVLLVVGNTIRLDIQSRREEIAVTRLLGATDGFVRRPFLYGGLWLGGLGGLVAVALVAVGTLALAGPVSSLSETYDSQLSISGLTLIEGVQLTFFGASAGWLGSWLAVGRELSAIQPR